MRILIRSKRIRTPPSKRLRRLYATRRVIEGVQLSSFDVFTNQRRYAARLKTRVINASTNREISTTWLHGHLPFFLCPRQRVTQKLIKYIPLSTGAVQMFYVTNSHLTACLHGAIFEMLTANFSRVVPLLQQLRQLQYRVLDCIYQGR